MTLFLSHDAIGFKWLVLLGDICIHFSSLTFLYACGGERNGKQVEEVRLQRNENLRGTRIS